MIKVSSESLTNDFNLNMINRKNHLVNFVEKRILKNKVKLDVDFYSEIGYPPEQDFNPDKLDKPLILYNSENRLKGFYDFIAEYNNSFTSREYWYGLREAFQMSDNLFDCKKEMKELFSSKIAHREYLMDVVESELLKSLPDQVTFFRGMKELEAELGKKESHQYGISWTLSRERAEFFAYTYVRNFVARHLP